MCKVRKLLQKIFCMVCNIGLLVPGLLETILYRWMGRFVSLSQRRVLAKIIKKNRKSLFGQAHNFESMTSDLSIFRQKVPIRNYEEFHSFIEKSLNAQSDVLTCEQIVTYQPSSGTTSATKHIPFTKALARDFQKGIRPWLWNLFMSYPSLLFGKMYWSLTPVVQPENDFSHNMPVEDGDYFSMLEKIALRFLFVVPFEVKEVTNAETFKYITVLYLVKNKNIRFISVWSPTFLSVLMNDLFQWKDLLVDDLKRGTISFKKGVSKTTLELLQKRLGKCVLRGQEVEDIFKSNALHGFHKLWPDLRVISCWGDGYATPHKSYLRKLFPGVDIQPKGLVATEAFVSLPLHGLEGHALSVRSHFFEFISLKSNEIYLAHELRLNEEYVVVVTTNGGLYRYNLADKVRVVGHSGKIPLFRFMGKMDHVMDLTGEKLHASFVENALSEGCEKYKVPLDAILFAPHEDAGTLGYVMCINEETVNSNILLQLAEYIDGKLKENFYYDYSRKHGQLRSVRVFHLTMSYFELCNQYLKFHNSRKKRMGDVKPLRVERNLGLLNYLKGNFIDEECVST